MDTTPRKHIRKLLTLALLASLSATAALVAASAEENGPRAALDTTVPAATTVSVQPGAIAAQPVIELPEPPTIAGDPRVDSTRAMSVEAPLQPGEYEWHPEASPAGEMVILVSIPNQEIHVYRGGVRIARASISTGRPGHDTPVGVFPILQKQRMHHSTLYDDAPMPFMQRLTWDGVAMHSGRNPGHPASHGCIRLPDEFAQLLYEVTDRGTTVVVADGTMFGEDVLDPGDFAPTRLLALADSAEANASE
jgi:lipoprotein-anchoring transpeptidase ErfK/SrfK